MANHDLGPGDVGRRVVVRRYVGVIDGRHRYTDLLGELTEFTDTSLTVRTRSGAVEVPLPQVRRAKTVPPRRGVTAREIAALERAATAAWPPLLVESLGEWRLRAAAGYTGRANSALPLGDPGVPLATAFDRVVDFYRSHRLPPQIDVPLPMASTVERELLKRGWVAQCTVDVQAAGLPELIAATPDGAEFQLSEQLSDQAFNLIAGRRFPDRSGPVAEAARHVLTAVDQLVFAERYDASGNLLSMGRGSVTDTWLGLFAVETVPAARRRGMAVAAVGALARWGAQHAAERAFLQVESTNEPALALYAKLGFARHHTYRRYRLPEH